MFCEEENTHSDILNREVTLPAMFETGEDHADFLDEFFDAKPDLIRLSRAMKLPTDCNQADVYEQFLRQFTDVYPRVVAAVRLMIVFAVNSSLNERVNAVLEDIKTVKRNRIEPKQLGDRDSTRSPPAGQLGRRTTRKSAEKDAIKRFLSLCDASPSQTSSHGTESGSIRPRGGAHPWSPHFTDFWPKVGGAIAPTSCCFGGGSLRSPP